MEFSDESSTDVGEHTDTVISPVSAVTSTGGGGGDKRRVNNRRYSSRSGGTSFWNDSLLKWEGSQSKSNPSSIGRVSLAQQIKNDSGTTQISDTPSNTAHFSQSQNTVVRQDDAKMRHVDLSSIEKCKVTNEIQINKEIENLETKLVAILSVIQSMQPNMHATERYQGTRVIRFHHNLYKTHI